MAKQDLFKLDKIIQKLKIRVGVLKDQKHQILNELKGRGVSTINEARSLIDTHTESLRKNKIKREKLWNLIEIKLDELED